MENASLATEWFVLNRNGRPYASRQEREPLVEIAKTNPDFTRRENGKMPQATIVRLVVADVVNL